MSVEKIVEVAEKSLSWSSTAICSTS